MLHLYESSPLVFSENSQKGLQNFFLCGILAGMTVNADKADKEEDCSKAEEPDRLKSLNCLLASFFMPYL